MVRVIRTEELDPDSYNGQELNNIYCGLDCCVTLEVYSALRSQLSGNALSTYTFERALQAPAMEMSLRGFAIDQRVRYEQITYYKNLESKYTAAFDRLSLGVFGRMFNPKSPKQLIELFYTRLQLPEVWEGRPRHLSTGRKALEKLTSYMYARPFVNCVTKLRDCAKILQVLMGGIDTDSRLRASYNVAGTETGRWSSSENAFGTGTNLQNITERLREMFIADAGMKIAYADLEQAESRAVGIICWMLFSDPTYLNACEGADLHTTVAKMVWPELPWNGNPKQDRAIADEKFYLEFSYRDLAKRGGHGTNYYGQPATMSKHLNVATGIIAKFQSGYFSQFSCIKSWHQHVAKNLQLTGTMTTFMGRERTFWGRLYEDETLREAIAFEPQSVVGDIMNKGILQAWLAYGREVQTHAQVHDAVIFQYPQEKEDEILPKLLSSLRVELTLHGRKFTIPTEAKVGWNWGNRVELKDGRVLNPNGLIKYKGTDKRVYVKPQSILHRVL